VVAPLARCTALVLLVAIAGAPGVGIACGLACDLLGHHGGGEAHAAPHDANRAHAQDAGRHNAGHHGTEPSRPAVASHRACEHAPQGIEAVVQRADLQALDVGREADSTTAATGAPAAPRVAGEWTARPQPPLPPESSSLRTTVLRL
jgi:hypothetical protein